MLLDSDILETRELDPGTLHVLSPDGWVEVTHVCKTVVMPLWVVSTKDFTLEASHKHLVVVEGDSYKYIHELVVGEYIYTENGLQEITEVYDTLDEDHMYDLRVNKEPHVYYSGGILGHNSTGLVSRGLTMCNLIDNYSNLYLAPRPDQVKTYADRMRSMERGSAFDPDVIVHKNLRNNLYFKEYPNGSQYRLMHINTDPSKARGQTTDEIAIDEIQDFDTKLIDIIAQTMKDSDHQNKVFTGTSTTKETALEHFYQSGSRGTWMCKSRVLGKHFPLDDPEILDDIIKIDGLTCPFSGKLVNPMLGEFVHEDGYKERMGNLSFHTPQIIVPKYSTGDKWLEIYRDFKTMERPTFVQEVMGIPVVDGHREISEQDLKNMCMDISEAKMQAEVLAGTRRYKYILSGCDWGGSDFSIVNKTGVSFTTHLMLGVTPNAEFEIFHMRRYSGTRYHDIAPQIMADHVKYKAFAIGSDCGGGDYYNTILRESGKIPTNKHFIYNYTAGHATLAPTPDARDNQFSLNRTNSISALYADIKRLGADNKTPNPRIRCFNWGDANPYLSEFLNVYRSLSTAPTTGKKSFKYNKNASKPDDMLHALNYARVTALTTIGESLFIDKSILYTVREAMGLAARIDTTGVGGSYFSG